MSKYVIQRREAGFKRYRVIQAPMLMGPAPVQGMFLTRWGAERWIKSVTWARLSDPQPAPIAAAGVDAPTDQAVSA